ncbi:hypothetical protein [Sphingomonas donggukensis]|nr:hypothetical protein [Sphingomonas donggukensis]
MTRAPLNPFVSSEVEKPTQALGRRFSTSLETNGVVLGFRP